MLDILVKDALVIDGTGKPGFTADVAVERGRIAEIGRVPANARTVIDGRGLVVCPGFIDMHSHSDIMLFHEPSSPLKIFQGVTTEVLGQDGIGMSPISPDLVPNWRRFMSGVSGNPPVEWAWTGLGSYLDALQQARTAVNTAALVPYGNIRLMKMGLNDRLPTKSEIGGMKRLLEEAMDEGAFGVSVGLIYLPCCFSTKEELIEVFRAVGERSGYMAIHMRNEGDYLIESLKEAIEIAEGSGVALHISHFKAAGKPNWHKYPEALEIVQETSDRGLSVSFDQYPYEAASTMLMALLPTWALEGGVHKTMDRLRDASLRAEMSRQFVEGLPPQEQLRSGWDNYVKYAGWDGIMVTAVKTERNKQFEGKMVSEIADFWGKSPEDALFDLLLQEECEVSMAVFFQSQENVTLGMKSAFHTVGTDGLLGGKPHPRAGGSYPRILGRYAREQKVLSLPDAITRMTSKPAKILGLSDRGVISQGYAADLVVFDPDTVIDTNSFLEPFNRPDGIKHVIVNGVLTVENSQLTGFSGGTALRKRGS